MNKRVFCIFLLFLLFCIFSLFLFNKIADKQYGKKEISETNTNPVLDYNNVTIVDSKLGSPYSITVGYLKNYAKKKSGIWYQSEAFVERIQKSQGITTFTLRDIIDKEIKIQATSSTSFDVKENDIVQFVGTLRLDDFSISLAKISKEEIEYQDATKVSFSDFFTTISLLEKQEFLIHGYLVKEDDSYYLYDSVEDYQTHSNKNFLVHWEKEISPEDIENKQISCQLQNSYTLKNCKLK